MIRRPFEFSYFPVDCGAPAAIGEGSGQQDVVDPQPPVFLKSEHPVVPPGETLVGLREEAKTVHQAETQQTL